MTVKPLILQHNPGDLFGEQYIQMAVNGYSKNGTDKASEIV